MFAVLLGVGALLGLLASKIAWSVMAARDDRQFTR